MMCSPLGAWHVALCELVFHWFFTKVYPSLPVWTGYVFEFVVGGLLLDGFVAWRDSGEVTGR